MTPRARKVVVDSDVLIQVLRGDSRVESALKRALDAGTPVAITPIAIAEIHAGMLPEEETRTRFFLSAFDCLRINGTTTATGSGPSTGSTTR